MDVYFPERPVKGYTFWLTSCYIKINPRDLDLGIEEASLNYPMTGICRIDGIRKMILQHIPIEQFVSFFSRNILVHILLYHGGITVSNPAGLMPLGLCKKHSFWKQLWNWSGITSVCQWSLQYHYSRNVNKCNDLKVRIVYMCLQNHGNLFEYLGSYDWTLLLSKKKSEVLAILDNKH